MQIHATLRHYAIIVRHRLIFILLGIMCCTATTGIISICIPPVYQARALLKVNNTAINGVNDISNVQMLAVDYALLITSPEVLQVVAQKLPGVTPGELQRAISDAPLEDTQIIEVRAQAGEAQLAAAMANMVTTIFIQIQAVKEADRLQKSANLLTQHIAATRLDLDAAQEYLNVLQNNHAAPASIAQQKSLVDTDQANYGLLLSDYSQIQVQKLQAASILSIAQAASPPDKPVSPQPLSNMLLALAMSLLFMILLVLLLDWLDTSIKTSEDVINLTGMLPLGCIPASSRMESAELLNLAAKSSIPVREALSMVGLNLRSQLNGQRFLLVSGARTGAGATTVATYLALSLARSGLRVLLLDANLHRPLLHDVFHAPNTHGLSNRLADVERFQEQPALYPQSWLQHWKTPFVNLWLLPIGPLPIQMAAAGIQGLQQLRTWLLGERQTSDHNDAFPLVDLIICDTAPLSEGSDTYALSTIADGIVMVVEAGREQRETLRNTYSSHLHAPILGVVVNRQRASQTAYYYVDLRNDESMWEARGSYAGKEEIATLKSEERVERSMHEGQAVSELPQDRFTAPHVVPLRKIAENPATSLSASRHSPPPTSMGRKLALVSKLVPKTPAPLSSSSGPFIRASQQVENVQSSDTETPASPLSQQGRSSVNTDPLADDVQDANAELVGARMMRASKPQFRTNPGKRV